MSEQSALLIVIHEVSDLNPAGDGIHLMMIKLWHFTAQNLSLSPSHCLVMT